MSKTSVYSSRRLLGCDAI